MKKYKLVQRILIPTLILGGVTAIAVPTLTSCSVTKLTLSDNVFTLEQLGAHDVGDGIDREVVNGWNDDWVSVELYNGGKCNTFEKYYVSKLFSSLQAKYSVTKSVQPGFLLFTNYYDMGVPAKPGTYTLNGLAMTQPQYDNIMEIQSNDSVKPSTKIPATIISLKIIVKA